jgi:branched-chain amino acid transport system permease protein
MLLTIVDIIISGLLLGGIFALIAVGLSLQYGVARVLNIAHGEFIMLGAFGNWILFTAFGINPLFAMLIVAPILFIIGFILYKTMYTRIRLASESPAAFEGGSLLASFGLLFIIQNLASLTWGADIKGYTFFSFGVNLGGGVIFSANRLITLLFAIGIGVIFYLFVTRTRMGKAIRAAAQDPATAGFMGVNIKQVLALCFGLGALMASFAGALLSMIFPIQTTMGLEYTVIAIIVVVLGGLGSIPGSFVGGFILGIVNSIVNSIEPSLSLFAYYLIFILLLLIKPTGIFGK